MNINVVICLFNNKYYVNYNKYHIVNIIYQHIKNMTYSNIILKLYL